METTQPDRPLYRQIDRNLPEEERTKQFLESVLSKPQQNFKRQNASPKEVQQFDERMCAMNDYLQECVDQSTSAEQNDQTTLQNPEDAQYLKREAQLETVRDNYLRELEEWNRVVELNDLHSTQPVFSASDEKLPAEGKTIVSANSAQERATESVQSYMLHADFLYKRLRTMKSANDDTTMQAKSVCSDLISSFGTTTSSDCNLTPPPHMTG